MSVGRTVYNEIVYGGHLLALGTSSMAATVALVLGRSPSWDLLLMAYLFSFGAYATNRLSDFEQDRVSHPQRTAYLEGRRGGLKWLAVSCFLLGYALAAFRNIIFFAGLLVPLVLAVAYSVSSKKMEGTIGISRLKEGALVKNLAISFGWSLVPVLVGLFYLDLSAGVLALAPYIFLRLMVNTIFFDQRDLEADKSFGVKTLPVTMGMSASSRVIDLLDISSGLYLLAVIAAGIVPLFAAFLVIFVPYSFAYRTYARTGTHKDSLRDLFADGEYLLWGVVTYIGHL
ncbi:MAG: UbiA family prenyltransferase [Thaumarchaeota archaeon]|nr:UbiA family prenyltransferase [Nitrososphaerota archaeon]